MSKKQKKPRIQKPFWERAYRGHAYWLGKKKLGRVTLADQGCYSCQAAGRAGAADDLYKAKQAVEAAVAMADKQLDLFG